MRYFIAPKSDTFLSYWKKHKYLVTKDIIYIPDSSAVKNYIKGDIGDVIIWGHGWWFHHWARVLYKNAQKRWPKMVFKFDDGTQGKAFREGYELEKKREKLQEKITNEDTFRFEIMDFSDLL